MSIQRWKQACKILASDAKVAVLLSATLLGQSSPGFGAAQPSASPQSEVPQEGRHDTVIDRPGPPPVRLIAAAESHFGIRLFREMLQTDRDANVILSPSSIATALAMVRLGASGETLEQINNVLEERRFGPEDSERGHFGLRQSQLDFDPDVSLLATSSLWAQKGFRFSPRILTANRDFFGAELQIINLADPTTPSLINQWAKNATQGRIETIIDEKIDPNSVLVLLSAISFKGKWAQKFDRNRTHSGLFVTATKQRKTVAMMEQSGSYRHLANDDFEAVALSYGKGRMSLYLFLPRTDQSLAEFGKRLDPTRWDEWMSQFNEMDGVVTLPRFRLEGGTDLRQALTSLGMGIAFDPGRADFSSLFADSPQRPFLKKVEHKAVIEVDEAGTKATAATSATIGLEGARKFFRLIFNRPFFLALRDNENGDLVFLGFVADPD